MPVKVQCPNCSHELAAPEEMVGQAVACPLCNSQFVISGESASPPASSMPPVSGSPSGNASPAEPPVQKSSAPPSGAARFKGMESTTQNPAEPPSSPPASTPPPTPLSSTKQQPRKSKSPTATKKQRKKPAGQAKFVTAAATKTDLRLGEDGKLPELAIADGLEREAKGETNAQANPLVMILVFGLSVGLTLAMLFMEPTTAKLESETKKSARNSLNRYFGTAPLKPYELLLREAIERHDKGDGKQETRRYRKVMNMLMDEHLDPINGLTGWPTHTQAEGDDEVEIPPSDKHLKGLLSKLLER
jgi:hypothetical protein